MEAQAELKSVYTPSEDVVARDLHDEFVIIPITSGIADLEDAIFSVNECGRAIWEKLDGKKSLKEVADALLQQYESDASEIEKDILGFTDELLKRKMVVRL